MKIHGLIFLLIGTLVCDGIKLRPMILALSRYAMNHTDFSTLGLPAYMEVTSLNLTGAVETIILLKPNNRAEKIKFSSTGAITVYPSEGHQKEIVAARKARILDNGDGIDEDIFNEIFPPEFLDNFELENSNLTTEEGNENPSTKPTIEPNEGPSDGLTIKTTEDTTKETSNETTEETTKETSDNTAEEATNKTAEETSDKATSEATSQDKNINQNNEDNNKGNAVNVETANKSDQIGSRAIIKTILASVFWASVIYI